MSFQSERTDKVRAIVIGNSAEEPHPQWLTETEGNSFLIGVDGGTKRILKAGLVPDLVIGDLDSLTNEEITRVRKTSTVYSYPVDKNFTDLQLALLYASRENFTSIQVYSWSDERPDYSLSTLTFAMEFSVPIDLFGRNFFGQILNKHRPELKWTENEIGERLSLISFSPFLSLQSQGLVWDLDLHKEPGPFISQSNQVQNPGFLKLREGHAFALWNSNNSNEFNKLNS